MIDERELNDLIDTLVLHDQQDEAEEILMREYDTANQNQDVRRLGAVLDGLVFVISSRTQPDVARAKMYCQEREKNSDTSYSKLKTGIFLFSTAKDYQSAVSKLRETIARAEEEADHKTRYTSLGFLGRSYLELDQADEALGILDEIERCLDSRNPIVIGDETVFLENAQKRGVGVESVRRIASALAGACRDGEFAARLRSLASQ